MVPMVTARRKDLPFPDRSLRAGCLEVCLVVVELLVQNPTHVIVFLYRMTHSSFPWHVRWFSVC